MDDPRSLNGDPLKDLFQEVGPSFASPDTEARVLARLSAPERIPTRTEAPLIPRWAWAAAAALAIVLMLLPGSGTIDFQLPSWPSWRMDKTATWILGSLSCATLLFALDTALGSRRWVTVR